ncbi:TetR family transcriptional regulator C-terminal domain-containing protein [Pelagicoccus mobilis]|uniref:TetR family transcriptional regulator C-terminal domain-containing protein n=1 Tax=Pelagicoccus mobilis TaxID=415221 RepID=A0A934RZV2_9BACT|nr:TetR family transcriptional regulator C-terminal domain-containing protein [Pelagicoccus mobilis]MBK1879701.1 TetR family transcriptional regulator C-terminal domain-containing protein [Pelagicoccus mobilis]
MASLVEGGNTLEVMLSRIEEIWQKDKDLDAALYSEIMAEASRSSEAAAIIRQHEIRLRERFAKVIAHGQEQGTIDKEIDAHGFATVIVAAVTGLRIADQAGTLLDRTPATQALATIVSRTLLPK